MGWTHGKNPFLSCPRRMGCRVWMTFISGNLVISTLEWLDRDRVHISMFFQVASRYVQSSSGRLKEPGLVLVESPFVGMYLNESNKEFKENCACCPSIQSMTTMKVDEIHSLIGGMIVLMSLKAVNVRCQNLKAVNAGPRLNARSKTNAGPKPDVRPKPNAVNPRPKPNVEPKPNAVNAGPKPDAGPKSDAGRSPMR
ncbi:hypothetical protein CRG98_012062 [Punica granatum]|uniref:Uncharacterized protein n=1 Tax=Punica granatum TaxID=22663 RepID=A0A2I0KG70_PUNGR|nr:hypothetical protein CRG98_012062 [Punica granatum]